MLFATIPLYLHVFICTYYAYDIVWVMAIITQIMARAMLAVLYSFSYISFSIKSAEEILNARRVITSKLHKSFQPQTVAFMPIVIYLNTRPYCNSTLFQVIQNATIWSRFSMTSFEISWLIRAESTDATRLAIEDISTAEALFLPPMLPPVSIYAAYAQFFIYFLLHHRCFQYRPRQLAAAPRKFLFRNAIKSIFEGGHFWTIWLDGWFSNDDGLRLCFIFPFRLCLWDCSGTFPLSKALMSAKRFCDDFRYDFSDICFSLSYAMPSLHARRMSKWRYIRLDIYKAARRIYFCMTRASRRQYLRATPTLQNFIGAGDIITQPSPRRITRTASPCNIRYFDEYWPRSMPMPAGTGAIGVYFGMNMFTLDDRYICEKTYDAHSASLHRPDSLQKQNGLKLRTAVLDTVPAAQGPQLITPSPKLPFYDDNKVRKMLRNKQQTFPLDKYCNAAIFNFQRSWLLHF